MNGPATVAAHLDHRMEAVIDLWRSVVRRSGDVPQSASLTRTQFRDHIPPLLDQMIERLRGHQTDVSILAEKHGHERWLQGYDVVEVVAELGHLRTAFVQATFSIAKEQGFSLEMVEAAHTAIHHVLNQAEAESVRQFQEDSHAQNARALEEIHERRNAVEAAHAAAEIEQEKLRALLESLPVGVWVVDSSGKIISMNQEAEGLQQLPAEDTIGRVFVNKPTPLYQFHRADGTGYRPEDLPISRAVNGEVVEQEEMLWAQPEGMRVIVASATPLRNPSDELVGAVVVMQDVTTRKRLESELVATSAQLKGIVEQSPVMIWRTGPDGRSDFVNKTYLEFLGTRLGDAVTNLWTLVVHPDDLAGMTDAFGRAYASREDFVWEFRVRDRLGRYRWLSSRGVPFFDEKKVFLGYLGTCMDITDQHELELALQGQRQIAEQSSLHKTRLMSALSHDARTPLNAVVLSAQLLEMHVQDGDDPEIAECLRTIRNGVKNVLDLLGDMLDLTRIDAGAMPVEISRFVIGVSILECVSSIQTSARIKGLDCRVELDGLTGLTIESDRAKFKQILANFLSNALRYTDRGLIRIFGELTPDQIRVSVQDSGVGIDPADQSRVFDEFATLENPQRTPGEGTGLGLAICRRLASLLGGLIELQSRPGEGSMFTLVLPASKWVEASPVSVLVTNSTELRPEGAILVAEDHADSRRTLGRLLRRMGYNVIEASDGLEALDLARAERPLAVLMDVNMPGMDGIDATLAIRAEPSLADLPIFALTGDVTAVNQKRIEDAGVQGYLEKPVTAEALRGALDTLKVS